MPAAERYYRFDRRQMHDPHGTDESDDAVGDSLSSLFCTDRLRGGRLQIRAVEPTDVDAIYAIALRTGASGQDATHLYADGKLVGHIWAAPYTLF